MAALKLECICDDNKKCFEERDRGKTAKIKKSLMPESMGECAQLDILVRQEYASLYCVQDFFVLVWKMLISGFVAVPCLDYSFLLLNAYYQDIPVVFTFLFWLVYAGMAYGCIEMVGRFIRDMVGADL